MIGVVEAGEESWPTSYILLFLIFILFPVEHFTHLLFFAGIEDVYIHLKAFKLLKSWIGDAVPQTITLQIKSTKFHC